MEVPTVKVCPRTYDESEASKDLKEIFSAYPFELDHFQKYAIEGIQHGAHVLVTAHTGSGKTLPAEHAIQHFCRSGSGERVIYTAPIKSLSNQKFREFTEKFPDISFGILTGDIKFNPEADCIIMTTEILRNALTGDERTIRDFTLDVERIRCVIFDEVHYINDRDRGMVWEETIIRLPSRVQTVMLSATIDRAEGFARWVATTTGRDVWLAGTDVRAVPLNHFSWWIIGGSSAKKLAGSPVEAIANRINDTLIPLKKHHSPFKTDAVSDLLKVTREVEKQRIQLPRRSHVFNCIARKLKDAGLLPALCFVFSRRRVLEHASEIEVCLFGDGEEKKPALVEKECRHILSSKLPDYQEYLQLPEYQQLLRLLQKGVAVHHSGMLPVLKEMVEMLFSRNYIKLLFATETFAVGVNMPTKTVLFSSLEKFDGNGFRALLSHEYTQMAGRAGRRGLDTVGHVIHLNNLFEVPYTQEYAAMLEGTPQSLSSKFDVTFELLLRASADSVETANKSMMSIEIQQDLDRLAAKSADLAEQLSQPIAGLKYGDRVQEYQDLQAEIELAKNKRRKRLIRDIKQLEAECPGIEEDCNRLAEREELRKELEGVQLESDRVKHYVEIKTQTLQSVLQDEGFLDEEGVLTTKGKLASQLNEVARLPFAEVLQRGLLDDLTTEELAAVLSCFTSIRVSEEDTEYQPTVQAQKMGRILEIFNHFYDVELQAQHYVDEDAYTLHYDLQSPVLRWCQAGTEMEARQIVEEVSVFLGEFVKAMLKINAIALELQRVCEKMDPPNVELKHRLSQIPERTLKYVVSNQSLYV